VEGVFVVTHDTADTAQPVTDIPEPSEAKRIEELEKLAKDNENKYLYLYAEFENYKKRIQKERSDLMKFGWEPCARELLHVVDNLERALAHVPAGTDKNLIDGLNMISGQFQSVLQKNCVCRFDTKNKPFDPNMHEAIGQIPSDQHPEGNVIKEEQSGYTMHGRLLRPARVIISSGNSGENKPGDGKD